ncbi:MAG TPA: MTH1187 family thiamine-binding protein [Acidimicrobiia bacterium]|nr:MTH1187 family thiamine-binding protein [Acidimicrobiia bacterium]
MIAAFSITPLGVGESVSEQVAEVVRMVRASGLANETNAMFTNVEGEWDDVMALIRDCTMKVAESAPRVSLVVKIDYRPSVTDGLTSKLAAVEDRLLRD